MTKILTGYDVLVCQKHLKQCHICIQNVITKRKSHTNMHKPYFIRHGYEGVMLVLCTPLQVKCYRSLQCQGA